MIERMPLKYQIALIVIILGCLLVSFLIGQGIHCIVKHSSLPPTSRTQAPLITFTQVQQQLVDRGHNIKVDGKICEGWDIPEHSETLTAWGKELCNQQASKMFKKTAGEKE